LRVIGRFDIICTANEISKPGFEMEQFNESPALSKTGGRFFSFHGRRSGCRRQATVNQPCSA
jgi:hypothetical protein